MNTVQTVQAWIALAPAFLQLAAFKTVTNAAVLATVPDPDYDTLATLNAALATEHVAAMKASAQ